MVTAISSKIAIVVSFNGYSSMTDENGLSKTNAIIEIKYPFGQPYSYNVTNAYENASEKNKFCIRIIHDKL